MSGWKHLTENNQISLEIIRNVVSMYVEKYYVDMFDKKKSNVIFLEY